MLASDILFNGDAGSPREALELYRDALLYEAAQQYLLDAQIEESDGFAQDLTDSAEVVKTLLLGMDEGTTELFSRWETSADEIVAFCGKVCLSGDFSQFAI